MKHKIRANIPLFVISYLIFAFLTFYIFLKRVGFEFAAVATPIIVLLFGVLMLFIGLNGRSVKNTPEEENRVWKTWENVETAMHVFLGIFFITGGIYNLSRFLKGETGDTAILTFLCFGIGLFLIIISRQLARVEIGFQRWFVEQVRR